MSTNIESIASDRGIAADEELARLFNLFRLCNLNVRYYGCRAEKYERLMRGLHVAAGIVSAVALFIILLIDSKDQYAGKVKLTAAALTGMATVLTGLAPLTGWSTKGAQMCKLQVLYSHLFGQVEAVITQIRRDGLTAGNIGASKQVHEAYRQMHALDELEPDQKLIDREDKKVREAFPADYLYSHL